MAQEKIQKAEAFKRTKIETTYEYVPILGQILGFWRKVYQSKIGEDVVLVIDTPLNCYDKLIINGEEIKIDK